MPPPIRAAPAARSAEAHQSGGAVDRREISSGHSPRDHDQDCRQPAHVTILAFNYLGREVIRPTGRVRHRQLAHLVHGRSAPCAARAARLKMPQSLSRHARAG